MRNSRPGPAPPALGTQAAGASPKAVSVWGLLLRWETSRQSLSPGRELPWSGISSDGGGRCPISESPSLPSGALL